MWSECKYRLKHFTLLLMSSRKSLTEQNTSTQIFIIRWYTVYGWVTVWFFFYCNKRTQYSSAPWHARYFCNSTFWRPIYGIYVIPSTKILENFFKGSIQLFTNIAKFDFQRPKNRCNWNQKQRYIFLILGGQFWYGRYRAKSRKVYRDQ